MENKKTNHIDILDRLIAGLRTNSDLSEDCRDAAIHELQKYIIFDFSGLDELRARWAILEDDVELAEKRMVSDLNLDKARAHLARCRARSAFNVMYGRELKKHLKLTKGGAVIDNNDD
jgi:hypothetical protein